METAIKGIEELLEADLQQPPDWWNHKGRYVYASKVSNQGLKRQALVLLSQGIWVWIEGTTFGGSRGPEKGWIIRWRITLSQREEFSGSIVVSMATLKSMFGLQLDIKEKNSLFSVPPWMVQSYGAENGRAGQFIRQGRFLNIPHPGTGHDGDPNVSILVDNTIQEAVLELVRSSDR